MGTESTLAEDFEKDLEAHIAHRPSRGESRCGDPATDALRAERKRDSEALHVINAVELQHRMRGFLGPTEASKLDRLAKESPTQDWQNPDWRTAQASWKGAFDSWRVRKQIEDTVTGGARIAYRKLALGLKYHGKLEEAHDDLREGSDCARHVSDRYQKGRAHWKVIATEIGLGVAGCLLLIFYGRRE